MPPLPIRRVFRVEEELYLKPNMVTNNNIPSGTRENKLDLDKNLDGATTNVVFSVSGLKANDKAKLLVLWETYTHTHHLNLVFAA